MMDKLTKEQRHRCMASIRSRDTKPELFLRDHGAHRRYRLPDEDGQMAAEPL